LWWQLVESLQELNPPPGRDEPDWASKIHFTIAPCYYHNYILGELLASQIHQSLIRSYDISNFTNNASMNPIGEFLRKQIFKKGASIHWSEMIQNATDHDLSVRDYLDHFIANDENKT
jgi:peptidyl-dipeptidase A